MPWIDIEEPNEKGWRRVRCTECGHVLKSHYPHERITCHCGYFPPPTHGPGTELHKLLTELGITPDASCGCVAMQAKMDAGGPGWCHEHRDEILTHLREAYRSTDWPTVLRAGTLAIAKGLPLTIEGLLAEAIRRAEQG